MVGASGLPWPGTIGSGGQVAMRRLTPCVGVLAVLGILTACSGEPAARGPVSQAQMVAGSPPTTAVALLEQGATTPAPPDLRLAVYYPRTVGGRRYLVPERHAVRLRPGQNVAFTVAAEPGRTFNATVDFIDPVVQTMNRTIMVKGRAPNPNRVLRPGMFIEARLATATRMNAIVIPEDAVQPLRTANVVWAVDGGKASRRVVQLGARSQGVVEILSGIKAGELVVVGGLERMAEGMPVAANARAKSPSAPTATTTPQSAPATATTKSGS